MKIALCVQVGTFSRFEIIKEIIDNFISVYSPDVYIACDKEDLDYFMEEYSNCIIISTPNLCTDIGKFLYTLKTISILEKDYDYCAKIHTKKPSKWTFDSLSMFHPFNFEKVLTALKEKNIGMIGIDSHIGCLSKTDNNKKFLKDIFDFYGKKYDDKTFISYKDLTYESFCSKVDGKFYSNHPNFNFLSNQISIEKNAFSFAASRNIPINKNHLNIQKCPKFVMGTIFICKYSILKKYLAPENIEFFLSEARYNNEEKYFNDFLGEKIAHSLERLFGFFCYWENLQVHGINFGE